MRSPVQFVSPPSCTPFVCASERPSRRTSNLGSWVFMVPGRFRRGGVLDEGLVSWLLNASKMLHNRVSEQCDRVACGVHRRILYCNVHAFSSDNMHHPVVLAAVEAPLRGRAVRPPTTLHNRRDCTIGPTTAKHGDNYCTVLNSNRGRSVQIRAMSESAE